MLRSLLLLAALLAAAPADAQRTVFVANQGDFSSGTGSVTAVETGGAFPADQLFVGQLGSILQSATRIGDRLYLVANSAERVDVVDLETRARVGQIAGGMSSPRYLAPTDAAVSGTPGAKAYLTNQVYGGEASFVLPLDLDAGTTGDPIPVVGLPEGIVVWNQKAYVALGAFGPDGGGTDAVAVIDTRSDVVEGYVQIGCYARFVVAAQSNYVLAFCEDTDEGVVIDSDTDAVVQRFAFGEDIGDPFGVGQVVGAADIAVAVRRAGPPALSFFVATASGVAEVGQVGSTDGVPAFGVTRTIAIAEADTRPISAVGAGLADVLVLGRPDPDNPFGAAGTLTIHDRTDGRLLGTVPAGIYPTHVALDERLPSSAAVSAPGGGLALALAGPNPARAASAVTLTLDRAADVRVEVLDVLGRRMAALAAGPLAAGTHRLAVDAAALAPGAYLVRATADGHTATLPLTVAR